MSQIWFRGINLGKFACDLIVCVILLEPFSLKC